jgi:hypothetical protein
MSCDWNSVHARRARPSSRFFHAAYAVSREWAAVSPLPRSPCPRAFSCCSRGALYSSQYCRNARSNSGTSKLAISSDAISSSPNTAERCDTWTSPLPLRWYAPVSGSNSAPLVKNPCGIPPIDFIPATSLSPHFGSRVRSHSVNQADASEPQSVPKPTPSARGSGLYGSLRILRIGSSARNVWSASSSSRIRSPTRSSAVRK